MSTALQELISVVERMISGGSTPEELTSALANAKSTIEADEDAKIGAEDEKVAALRSDLDALTEKVAALPAPAEPAAPAPAVDLGPLNAAVDALGERVKALEDRNAADDAAASGLSGAPLDPAAPVVISLSAIPDTLTVGSPYSASITATGSTALPYAFSIGGGALPDGLSLGAGGLISGTPTTAGVFQVSVQAHDANNLVGVEAYTLTVDVAAPAPAPVADAPAAA